MTYNINKMDNSSSDILEITAVYGTQAVFIKKEVDVSDTEDFKEDIIIKDDTSRHDLLSVPLVYTTRLDQMNAFKKIEKLTSKEATEMILIESKPRYVQISEQIKQEVQSDSYSSSYIQLCSHVLKLKTKVRTEAYNISLRNEKLMKMCKPLKIVLEDFKANKVKLPSIKIDMCSKFIEFGSDEETPSSILSDVDGLSSWSSDEDVSLSHSFGNSKVSKETLLLAIKDRKSQKADIYILDAFKDVKSYYRTHIKECNKLQKRHLSKRTIILQYCCWVNREKRVKKIIQTNFAGASVSNFLRKPHNCIPGSCTCCCVLGTPITKKHSDDKFKHSNKRSLMKVSMPGNVLIEKAYVYFNKKINTVYNNIKPQTEDESTIYLKCAVIIIKYQGVIFAQAELLGENYEIGDKGDIEHFMKPTVNRSITEEKEIYQKNDENRKITRQYFSYLICCWHMRETIIGQLRDCNKLLPNAFKFMRNPHLCKSDKCVCCCKPAPILSLPSKNVTITTKKNTKPSKKQIKVKQAKPGRNEKNYSPNGSFEEHSMETQNLERTQNVKKRTTKPSPTITICSKKPRITQNISQNDKNPIGFAKPRTIQDCIDLNIDSSFESNPNPTIPPNCDSSNYTDTKHSPAMTPAISGISDKVKGLKLSLNENGKLAAMINTHPSQLSTEEIKVLSDILLLATTQIKKLGISPEEFCKRFNSRAMAGPSSSVIPPLVPILEPPIINKATINKNDRQMPEFSTSNFTNTAIQSQYVTTCYPQGCKAHSLNISFPKTHNISTASGFYQVMSSLGGIKNQHLVTAYKRHFKEKIAEISSEQETPTMIPKISEVYSLVDNEPIVKSKRTRAPAKHKNPQKAKQTIALKKIRFTSEEVRKKAESNPLPLFVSDTNLIPIHNTVGKDVSESVMEPHHSQMPVVVSNGNLIQIHKHGDTSGRDVQQPMMGADLNPPPLVVSNTNFIAMQNVRGTNVLESQNQIPLFVKNSNFIPTHSTSDRDIQQPMVEADVSRPSHFVSNSRYTAIQNTIDAVVPASVMGAQHSQIQFFVSNGNLIPIHNTSSQAEHNQTPPCVTNSNLIPNRNTIKNNKQKTIGMDISESNAEAYSSHTPDVGNAIPIPNDTVVPGMLIMANTTSTPSNNPLLFQMLAKTRTPPPPALAPLSSPHSNASKNVGRPLILAHSKGSKRQEARKILKAPKAVQLKENAVIDIEMDFESSLKTNVINNVSPDQSSGDEVSQISNNIPIILFEDNEEEGIFGI